VPSFYDSDDNAQKPKQRMKSPRVKESPFKIIKSSRKSQSPAVSSATRRTPTRRTPRVRLRHDNSQIQFEPIVSSPSNPFVQESQILTERQIEMIERQMAPNLFANLGSASSPTRPEATASANSPLEIHSDAMDADGLPMEPARTPLRNLSSLGPMDVFVGSSPTPQARTRTQDLVSDQRSVATPTAVRTMRLADDSELESSPPRFEKDAGVNSTGLFNNSVAYRPPERSFSFSFDDGTTFEDVAMPQAGPTGEDAMEDVAVAEISESDMLSSTIDLQLTAQIDADIQAQMEAGPSKQAEDPSEEMEDISMTIAMAEASRQEAGLDTRNEDALVEDTQIETSTQTDEPAYDAESSSTSRIGDSFSSQAANLQSPQVRSLRSSQRIAASSSPSQHSSATKRKSSGRGRGRSKRSKTEEAGVTEGEASPALSEPVPDSDGMLENIVVASPQSKATSRRAGKVSLGPRQSELVVPETNRKRVMRRSASLLSQVEAQGEDMVQDTPKHKRARRSVSQDVSGAKTTPKGSQTRHTARLSHVQVTPRRSSDIDSTTRSSSVAVDETIIQAAAETLREDAAEGEQATDVALQMTTSIAEPRQSQNSTSTPSRSFAERVILTPRSIINQLRHLKDALFRSSQLVLGRQEEREIDDALFELRREVHEAGRRGDERS
jgi:hypothetical protein